MKLLLHSAITALLLAPAAEAGAQTVNLETFDTIRAGRNAFVKMFAPWCGHCKAMKEDWDKLGDMYAGSSSVLIGDVDCTSDEGKAMCEKFEVKGYPTLKYFVDGDTKGTPYSGGRDYDSLLKHIQDELEAKCDVKNPVDCTQKEKDYIEKMSKATPEARAKQLSRLEGMLGDSMKAELKQWLNQRFRILKALGTGISEEL